MIKKLVARSRTTNWGRTFSLVLIVVLLIPLVATVPAPDAAPRAQPVLLAMAAEHPDETVGVIVQKRVKDTRVENMVARLGGAVTKDLYIINAFAAELPAKAVPELAKAAGVRWVSLDAPVVEADDGSGGSMTVRDEFNAVSYNDNDGIVNWTGDWVEIGESDGPEVGDIAVTSFLGGTRQGLRIQNANKGVWREANLSGATSAVLSFEYRRKGFDDSSDYVIIEISADGGALWKELERFAGPATDPDVQLASYDISSYVSSTTAIRLVSSWSLGEQDKLYIDNVQIKYTLADGSSLEAIQGEPALSGDSLDALKNEPQFASSEGSGGGDSGSGSWQYRRKLIFDNLAQSENLVDFPVLVKLDSTRINYSQAQDNGEDIRFYDADDTPLAYEIEEWDESGTSYVWVKVPQIDGSSSTDYIWMYYGNASASDGQDAANVWDSNFKGVWHLNQTVGGGSVILDSTSNSNDGADMGTPTFGVTGQIGTAIDFDGISAYIRVPSSDSLKLAGGLTIEVWMKVDNWGDWQNVVFKGDDSASNTDYQFALVTEGLAWDGTVSGDWRTKYFDTSKDTGAWISAVVTHDTSIVKCYRGGLEIGSQSDAGVIYGSDVALGIAAVAHNGTNLFDGTIDEVRISGTARSADWIAAQYASMTDAFIIYGAQEEIPGDGDGGSGDDCIDTSNLTSAYIHAIGADQLWNGAPPVRGQGVTVAVVDSGIASHDDLKFRIRAQMQFLSTAEAHPDDYYGHGSHVAGTIGGNGAKSDGAYIGVAPKVNLVDVKVIDDYGTGTTSDVVAGLQWIYENKAVYDIRVVNLSLNSTVAEPYHTSPLDAALEILWFNGIVVVVSAGNNGSGPDNGILYPPANDPFVIVVGAADDMGTADIADDVLSSFSAYGMTVDGFAKPDLVAPGRDIISLLASDDCNLAMGHPAHAVAGPDGNYYFRMSGTSMASAVTAGAVALLLQDEPDLTPNQVKHRLMATTAPFDGPEPGSTGAGYLDIYAAVYGTTTESANVGIMPHQLLAKMALIAFWASENGGDCIDWESVNWDSVNWDSVNWDSVNWDSVNWDSVNWDSVNWDSVNWDSVNWDSVNWDSVNWDSVNWDSVNWDSVNWDSVNWDSVNWDD